MILTKENIQEWKIVLDMQFKKQYNIEKFSETKRDSEWIDDFLGYGVQDAINEEIECWSE